MDSNGRWITRLRREVDQLPETLATLRQSADNLKAVSDDLTGVAANLRRVSDALEAAGLQETTEAMKRSGEAFRASVARFEEAETAMRTVNNTLIDSVSWLPGAKDVLKPFRRPEK